MLRILRHYARALRRGEQLDRDVDRELRFHLEMETEKHQQQGALPPDEARAAALRRFGGVQKTQEECRDERHVTFVDNLRQDLRYGARSLRRSPGFAIAAIVTLGLGIGANVAIFSLIHGVLLEPLPYADSDRLLLVRQSAPLAGREDVSVSIKELYDYRAQTRSFDGLVEFHQMSFDLLKRGEPDRVDTGVVSHNFFDVLGVKPVLGRTFVASDEGPSAPAVLVLSHSYWQSRFAGDAGIVGQVLQMNDRAHTVIGVLPPVPLYPSESDVYMPTSACPFRAAAERRIEQNRRAFSNLIVFGKHKAGVTRERATTDVQTVAARFAQDSPTIYRADTGFRVNVTGVLEELTRNARPMLLVLLGVTGLVLLISCANVANLALARMLRREPEIAMRLALGASRGRILQQLLTESLIVSLLSGVVGLLVAWLVGDLLSAFVARLTSRTTAVTLDVTVLAFTLVVAVLTGLLFGTLPAMTSLRSKQADAVKAGSRTVGDGRARRRLQRVLIVAQVAIAFVLLVGSGQLLVSFYRLHRTDAGYKADRVLTAEVFGNFSKYRTVDDLRRLYLPLIDRLESRPGVLSAAVTNGVPLSGISPAEQPFEIEGRAADNAASRPSVDVRIASPRYFETLGIPLRSGRTFTQSDDVKTPPVVVINESMTRYWNGADPVGSRIAFGDGDNRVWVTVVGVVGNVRQFALERDADAQVYLPLAQSPVGLAGRVMVRVTGNPLDSARLIREEVRALDPNLPVENVQTLEALRTRALATPGLTAVLLSIFAVVALAVTLAGIAGIIAMSVTQRTPEFGLRMALGASRGNVLGLVLGQGVMLVGAGLVVGIPLSLALGTVVSSSLFALPRASALTVAVVATMFLLTAVLACLGPARRATKVDPILALRAE
jgi:putative ABC transport system permease protein